MGIMISMYVVLDVPVIYSITLCSALSVRAVILAQTEVKGGKGLGVDQAVDHMAGGVAMTGTVGQMALISMGKQTIAVLQGGRGNQTTLLLRLFQARGRERELIKLTRKRAMSRPLLK